MHNKQKKIFGWAPSMMVEILRSIVAPVASLIILVMGNGLFLTYVTVRLRLEGYGTEIIGLITAAYYAGLFFGSIRSLRLIERIGHIRSFATFASLTAVLVMFQAFFVNAWVWLVLRFLGGIFMAGLFITIESWLLVRSTIDTRGQVLSIYMTAFYAAQGAGQFLLDLSDPMSLIPFCITVILSSLSVVPVCMTRTTAPILEEPSFLNVFQLFKISPLGVTGCILAGVILGTVYGLLPIYGQETGLSVSGIAVLMGVTIFGGLALQWPIGRISDHIDRRKVLFIVSIITVGLSLLIAIFDNVFPYLLFVLSFLFGGFSFTLYPLSISHACDHVEPKDIVSATGGLLLSYGVGAIIGPLIAPFPMDWFGSRGLFFFFAIFSGILALFTVARWIKTPPVPEEEKLPYANVPRTTPISAELDPRSEEGEEERPEDEREGS